MFGKHIEYYTSGKENGSNPIEMLRKENEHQPSNLQDIYTRLTYVGGVWVIHWLRSPPSLDHRWVAWRNQVSIYRTQVRDQAARG